MSLAARYASMLTAALAVQVSAALLKSGAVKLAQLCVSPGKVAWTAHLDMYILAADGALLDTVLFAAVACLSTLKLPAVPLTPEGTVCACFADQLLTCVVRVAAHATPVQVARGQQHKASQQPLQPLQLALLPTCLTCAFIGDKVRLACSAIEQRPRS